MLENLKTESFLGNSLFDYLLVFCYILAGVTVILVFKKYFIKKVKAAASKTQTKIDDAVVNLTSRFFVPLLDFGVIYLSIMTLELNGAVTKALNVIGAILLTLMGVRFIIEIVKFSIFDYWLLKKKERMALENQFKSMMPLVNIMVWGIGLVFLLDMLGFNITAIVTGLGIGGVAVALAGAAILGDLFAYISIMLDRPFILGDFLIVGDFLGTVEHIGIKTTRLRSLSGEVVIFSNKDLTDSRVRNYKLMKKRRIVFKLGVTYDTKLDQMKEIPEIIEGIIAKIEKTDFKRAHFSNFGDFNLEIEVVYVVLSGDYNEYMDIQQEINFEIKREFEKRNIEFAFPTQTLYVNKS